MLLSVKRNGVTFVTVPRTQSLLTNITIVTPPAGPKSVIGSTVPSQAET